MEPQGSPVHRAGMAAIEETCQVSSFWQFREHGPELVVDHQAVASGAAIDGAEALVEARRVALRFVTVSVLKLGAVPGKLEHKTVSIARIGNHSADRVADGCGFRIVQSRRLVAESGERPLPELGVVDATAQATDVAVVVDPYAKRQSAANSIGGGGRGDPGCWPTAPANSGGADGGTEKAKNSSSPSGKST